MIWIDKNLFIRDEIVEENVDIGDLDYDDGDVGEICMEVETRLLLSENICWPPRMILKKIG